MPVSLRVKLMSPPNNAFVNQSSANSESKDNRRLCAYSGIRREHTGRNAEEDDELGKGGKAEESAGVYE